MTLWDDDSPHFELYKRGIGAFAEYTWAGDKKTNDEYKSLFRHRTFGPKWEDEKFAFIDSIEGPVGAWVNALVVDKSHRNSLKKNDNPKKAGDIICSANKILHNKILKILRPVTR